MVLLTAMSTPTVPPEHTALLGAVQAVLRPLAQLLVARGLPYAQAEERLKAAYVQAARDAALRATPEALPHRLVSRLSTATGINRREVGRLLVEPDASSGLRPSMALRVFERWRTDPDYLNGRGQPQILRRQGVAPSFEALAAQVSRDVHARSVLDDMVRLKLVEWETDADTVTLRQSAFVPDADTAKLMAYLGANVGDHLSAAVENVGGLQPRHFEQAIWADGLTLDVARELRAIIEAQWKLLSQALVPEIQRRIDAVESAGLTPDARVRVGVYMYSQQDDGRPAAQDQEGKPHA
jgi:hypothetical protein